MASARPQPVAHTGRERARVVLVALFGCFALLTLGVFYGARVSLPGHRAQTAFSLTGLGMLQPNDVATGSLLWGASQVSDLLRGWIYPFTVAARAFLYLFGLSASLHFFLVFPRRHPMLTHRPWLVFWIYAGIWILYAAAFLIGLRSATTPSAVLRLAMQADNVTFIYAVLAMLAAITAHTAAQGGE